MVSSSSAVGVRSKFAISMARPSMSMGTNRASQLPEAEASAASRCSLASFTSTSSTVPTSIWPSLLESAITVEAVVSPSVVPAGSLAAPAHRDSARINARPIATSFFEFILFSSCFFFIYKAAAPPGKSVFIFRVFRQNAAC